MAILSSFFFFVKIRRHHAAGVFVLENCQNTKISKNIENFFLKIEIPPLYSLQTYCMILFYHLNVRIRWQNVRISWIFAFDLNIPRSSYKEKTSIFKVIMDLVTKNLPTFPYDVKPFLKGTNSELSNCFKLRPIRPELLWLFFKKFFKK